MYSTQIKDITTVTWHNLHFILEHYSMEALSILEKIIQEGEENHQELPTAKETKREVISIVKTLKAIHTVLTHHRYITAGEKQ